MARINRSEWSVNQQLASTPRPVTRMRPARRTLPLSRVLGWMVGAVVLVVIIKEVAPCCPSPL